MHAGFRAIENGVAFDRIQIGADIDGVKGSCAKDFVEGDADAVPGYAGDRGEYPDGCLTVAEYIVGDRNPAAFCRVEEQNIGRSERGRVVVKIVDHGVLLNRSRGSKRKLDTVLSRTARNDA